MSHGIVWPAGTQRLSAMDEVSDFAHLRQFLFGHGTGIQCCQVLPHLVNIAGPHHTDIDAGMRQDKSVAVHGAGWVFTRRHFPGFEQLLPAGGGECNDTRTVFAGQERKCFSFRTTVKTVRVSLHSPPPAGGRCSTPKCTRVNTHPAPWTATDLSYLIPRRYRYDGGPQY